MDTANPEGSSSTTSIPSDQEGSTVLGLDSALKVIEVTAQQVVDRITSQENTDPEIQKINSSSPRKKISIETNGKSGSETSLVSTRSLPSAGTGNVEQVSEESVEKEDKSSPPTASPASSKEAKNGTPMIKNKRAEQLLVLLQNWVKEATGKRGAEAFPLRDNLYYLYSIESFLRDLPWSSQEQLAQRFSSSLLKWLKRLFDFRDASDGELDYNSILPHWDKHDGAISVTKWHLHLNFPNLLYSGHETYGVEDRFPVIYCSDEDIGTLVTSSLGLSKECFSLVNTHEEDWVVGFEEIVLFDKKRNLIPIIFLLNIASNNLEKGCHFCHAHGIPVHIYGRNTFSCFVKRQETDQIGTSFTIELNTWIPSPFLPHLTVLKKPPKSDSKRLQVSGLASINKNLMTLVPWFCTEAFGPANTRAVVEDVCECGQFLLTILKKYDFLTIIPNWTTLSDGQVIVSSLIFRFNAKPSSNSVEGKDQPSPQYVNVLNSWLYHILERDMNHLLNVQFVDVKGSFHILFDVFKIEKLSATEEEFVEKSFDHHMRVLESTLTKKSEFVREVAKAEELESVDYDTSWAGLGAVRYIPKFYREGGKESNKGPPPVPANENADLHRKSNINHLNAQIVDKLKSIDNAFSLGVVGEGDWCVQFGMVTDETEVAELLRLVIATGEEIEESSEFFHQMSELVKKGIEKATEELKRESEEALWEEGILRRVPVVGTFVNWFSPPSRESGIRGRALNLVQGKVESTENIYKYHMQVETPSSPSAATAILNRFNSFSK